MSHLLCWLKEVYGKAKAGEFEWKTLYPNNMICSEAQGIYTDMNLQMGDKYTYVKHTIQYGYRCDKNGARHKEEGVKYYILHELRLNDLEKAAEIPEPWNKTECTGSKSYMVNDYGRFRYVFDDEETAKSVVAKELIMMIYPYTYLLSKEEQEEWERYMEEKK